ncbi:hypothetical protein EGW08_020405, partial [Elysia chlorotica]
AVACEGRDAPGLAPVARRAGSPVCISRSAQTYFSNDIHNLTLKEKPHHLYSRNQGSNTQRVTGEQDHDSDSGYNSPLQAKKLVSCGTQIFTTAPSPSSDDDRDRTLKNLSLDLTKPDVGGTEMSKGRTKTDVIGTEMSKGRTKADVIGTEMSKGGTKADVIGTEMSKGRTKADVIGTEMSKGRTKADVIGTEMPKGRTKADVIGTE